MGGREAAVDRGGGGGAAAGHGGARQDPLHRPLPHRRLLLGSQGIHSNNCICISKAFVFSYWVNCSDASVANEICNDVLLGFVQGQTPVFPRILGHEAGG